MCDKKSALVSLSVLGDAINSFMNHSDSQAQDVINALERQTKRMTSFLEENQFNLPQPVSHAEAHSISARTRAGEDEEKEPIVKSHQLHKLN